MKIIKKIKYTIYDDKDNVIKARKLMVFKPQFLDNFEIFKLKVKLFGLFGYGSVRFKDFKNLFKFEKFECIKI